MTVVTLGSSKVPKAHRATLSRAAPPSAPMTQGNQRRRGCNVAGTSGGEEAYGNNGGDDGADAAGGRATGGAGSTVSPAAVSAGRPVAGGRNGSAGSGLLWSTELIV